VLTALEVLTAAEATSPNSTSPNSMRKALNPATSNNRAVLTAVSR
jgi:hypothetical protein